MILGRWVINISGAADSSGAAPSAPSCDDQLEIVECDDEFEEILVEEGY